MQRRGVFFGLIGALFGASVTLASDYQSSVEAQLRAQGFSDIRVETTWLGRLKITAQRRGAGREIVLNPRSGEILRDLIRTKNGAVMPRISDERDDNDGDDRDDGGDARDDNDGDARDDGGDARDDNDGDDRDDGGDARDDNDGDARDDGGDARDD